MIHTLPQSIAAQPPQGDAVAVWLPVERMRRYQWAKGVGAIFIGVIFAGWLFIQWSNPVMRLLASALLLATLWITGKSILADALRMKGRRLWISPGTPGYILHLLRPEGESEVRLADVAEAHWRDDTEAAVGLWLLDGRGQALGHIDHYFLATEAEARPFLTWLRQHANAPFEVRWPAESNL
jgi:hypothetical protein